MLTISSTDQVIQLAIAITLAITLSLIFSQLVLQKRLARAQLLRDRFEMYLKANEPVTDKHIEDLKLYPADYMDIKLYEDKYKADEQAIRKYIYMAVLYEYLAFTHAMPQAPFLAPNFLKMWVTDLCQESEFHEVHKYYKKYYPLFAEVVSEVLGTKQVARG